MSNATTNRLSNLALRHTVTDGIVARLNDGILPSDYTAAKLAAGAVLIYKGEVNFHETPVVTILIGPGFDLDSQAEDADAQAWGEALIFALTAN